MQRLLHRVLPMEHWARLSGFWPVCVSPVARVCRINRPRRERSAAAGLGPSIWRTSRSNNAARLHTSI